MALGSDEFEFEISFDTGGTNVERIFQLAEELTGTLSQVDNSLVELVHPGVSTFLVLSEISAGSLRVRLRNVVRALDDEGLRKVNLKEIVGPFLVRGKYRLLSYLDEDASSGKHLAGAIHSIEQDAESLEIESDSLVPRRLSVPQMVTSVRRLNSARSYLENGETLAFHSGAGRSVVLKANAGVSLEHLEESLVAERYISPPTSVILKVKKPDYLGKSKWEFRLGNRRVFAHISDLLWLKNFQETAIQLMPGDSLKCQMQTTQEYGPDRELIDEFYEIQRVDEVIHHGGGRQLDAFDNKGS